MQDGAGNAHDPHPRPNRAGDRPRGDITLLLDGACAGADEARQQLLSEVYDELRVIAASSMRSERPDHTLGATALVNESYLKLFRAGAGAGEKVPELSFEHRHAFFKAASVAMRRILIDHARARAAEKRRIPANRGRISADLLQASAASDPHDLLALSEALDQLEREDERAASVVRLRFFAGRELGEIARMLDLSTRTVKRDWEFARARLQQLIEHPAGDQPPDDQAPGNLTQSDQE